MFTIDKVAKFIENTINKITSPAEVLPDELLLCTVIRRPGLSAYKIASEVITNNKAIGIQTGPNQDGSPNKINEYTYNIVKCIVDGIKNDAVVQAVLPAHSLMIEATGGNAGGPVTVVGTNIKTSKTKGLIR